MKAIIKKELRAYFNTPVGYVFIAVLMCVSAILFTIFNLMQGSSAIGRIFSYLPLLFIILIPLLTMRLMAEERSMKTDQLLLTAPIKVSEIVWGKLVAASVVFAAALVLMLVYPIILSFYSDVEWGVVASDYVGFFLLGFALLSVGIFISCLTENQIIAAVVSIAVFVAMFLVSFAVGSTGNGILDALVSVVSVTEKFDNFSVGIISIPDVLYYISVAVVFVLLTIACTEKRRIS